MARKKTITIGSHGKGLTELTAFSKESLFAKGVKFNKGISYQKSVQLLIKPEVKGVEETQAYFDRITNALFFQLPTLALAGAHAIQQLAFNRLAGKYSPGPFMSEKGITEHQPAVDQFVKRVLPLLFSEPTVMYGSKGKITMGIFNLEAASQITITDIITMSKTTNDPTDQASLLEKDVRQMDSVQIRGGGSGKVTPTDSEFIHTWQMMEFGTGIFAQHPEWGWGRRLEGGTFKNGMPIKVPGGKGAWNLAAGGPVMLGQKGGHFLFGVREQMSFALQNYEAAVDAIVDKLNELSGIKAVAGGRMRRQKG